MTRVVIALGSNVGNPIQNVVKATENLANHISILSISPLYQTTPMYLIDQPDFINGALLAETNLSPLDLLRLLKSLEQDLGRETRPRNGPREIDLDLISYGSLTYRFTDEYGQIKLQVPHPRIVERRFVLAPLMDIAPSLFLPGLGIVSELIDQTKSQIDSVLKIKNEVLSIPSN